MMPSADEKAFTDLLAHALQENGLLLSADMQQKLVHYLQLLTKWNRVFNLTTVIKPREMVYLHVVDSLLIQPYLQGHRFLDVGSGGGLPGLIIAITHPLQEWTLIDKNSKKIHFLTQAAAELELKNVKMVHERVENFHPDACFDSIVSRAFSTISTFVETTKHLLCPHGILLAMKGKYPQEELENLPAHTMVRELVRLEMTGMQRERHLLCLQMQ